MSKGHAAAAIGGILLAVAILVFLFVNGLHKYVDFGNTGILISAASEQAQSHPLARESM